MLARNPDNIAARARWIGAGERYGTRGVAPFGPSSNSPST